MAKSRPLTFKEAKIKAAAYCAYQERTQQEVRSKLYDIGLYGDEIEELIAELISENFINEERFAKAYAGGKFRMNHWGRLKIQAGLQAKGLSKRCIETGLGEIDDEAYEEKIDVLIRKKAATIKEADEIKTKYKIANYLINKGFEPPITWNKVNAYFANPKVSS